MRTGNSGRSADRNLRSQRGVSIVENLIAISLLGIVLASSAHMIISTIHANRAARSFAGAVAEVQKKVDGYRTGTYSQLLDKFGTTHGSISNDQTATETSASEAARTTFLTTFTAIKTSNTAFPEAVKVTVDATQRRGTFGESHYKFETVIAHIR